MAARGGDNMVQIQLEDGQCVFIDEDLAKIYLAEDGDPETKRAIRDAILACRKSNSTSPGTLETIPIRSSSSESPSSGPSPPSSVSTSSSDSQQTMHVWNESEERFLIDLRLQREERFLGTKSHDFLWGEISSEMKKNGIHVSKTQLINKWKALKKKYKEVNDENNKTGNQKHSWKYFDQFSEVYGNKASTNVSVSFDTGRRDKMKINIDSKDEDISLVPEKEKQSTSSDTDSKSTATGTKLKSKKRKMSDSTKLIENIQDQNRELMNSMEKHHEEKMRRIDRMLELLEKSLDK
ncbi:uncharacterized protein LOC125658123 [Ostrea edulis]|uniref:uncharacterized protein LOC125658123 n=1 Tax=Ostrea edulis TaxID=37623 RepID=UPI0024AEAB20|nr:uncharacterized protein LOC125658123 [Ostrea edulis]